MASNIKNSTEMNIPEAYELVQEETIQELNSLCVLLRHKKSGARVCVLSNDDENKVFSIGFRTPPKDDTGVAHIIEHTVLCGSKNFPLKDPFMELVKGSLNTFLNAMTYPDKTIYPVASCNDKDFSNLMHVYMDAVFYPDIYREEKIFKQEGWHYELDSLEDTLRYNGVVYNEMKGVFSSPEEYLLRMIQEVLYPDTPYGVESGGNPEAIPDLSYEEFLDFHRRYYHPCNSYIYLYGNMDARERLEWMDVNYLSAFDEIPLDSAISRQEAFSEIREKHDVYSASEEGAEEDKTYLAYSVVIDTSLNKELYMAFQILEYVLLDNPGAPLKQALLDAGLGDDIMSIYENGIYQPNLSIVAKNAKASDSKRFLQVIRETVEKLVQEGLDEKSLLGAINYFEFRSREADYGSYPKGLVYGTQMLDSWLYDDSKPFLHLKYEEIFVFLKEKVGTGYYEELLKKYILENTHAALLVLSPEKGLASKMEKETEEKLKALQESLSEEEQLKLVEETKALKAYQEEPVSPEALEKIPMLTREDIKKEIQPLYNKEYEINGVKSLHHDIFSNGIIYARLEFDITGFVEYAPYISLLATVLGYMDTRNYTYLELSNETNLHTGGIVADTNLFRLTKEEEEYRLYFEMRTKVLYDKVEKATELIREMLYETMTDDDKRLREILAESKSRLEMRLQSAGHGTAVNRASSYYGKGFYINDMMSGIGYYRFIENLYKNFEEEKTSLKNVLQYLLDSIFRCDTMLISCTADQKGYEKAVPAMEKLVAEIRKQEKKPEAPETKLYPVEVVKKNEGFITPGQVQFVARAGNFKQAGCTYTGALQVLKAILSYDYLWNQVRVKGGAYGCMCGFSMDGDGYFASYRDPNLGKTNEIFEKAVAYIQDFDASDREMTKYVIGAISELDTPLNPGAKGRRSLTAYLKGTTEEILQRNRNQVLSADVEAIRATASLLRAVLDADCLCTVGSKPRIEEEKELFLHIENLV